MPKPATRLHEVRDKAPKPTLAIPDHQSIAVRAYQRLVRPWVSNRNRPRGLVSSGRGVEKRSRQSGLAALPLVQPVRKPRQLINGYSAR